MREVSLRQFRVRGAKALEDVPQGEIVLLTGRRGPTYFLIPVLENVVAEERELLRAMAKARLRQTWRIAGEAELDPDGPAPVSEEEIDREINLVRQRRMTE